MAETPDTTTPAAKSTPAKTVAKKAGRSKTTSAKMAATTKANSQQVAVTTPNLDARTTVIEILSGEMGRDTYKTLPVPVQALLVEVLMERDRAQYTDANMELVKADLRVTIIKFLGCNETRVRAVIRTMRERGSYESKGRGSNYKEYFWGSDEARDILAQLKPAPAATPVTKDEPKHAVASPFVAPSASMPAPVAAMALRVHRDDTIIVSPAHVPLTGANAGLVRVLTDQVVAATDGDDVLVAGVIEALATRFGFVVTP